jgi:hypothetical protein
MKNALTLAAFALLFVAAVPITQGNVFTTDILVVSDTKSRGSCTLDGASPSKCTATVTASTKCVCSPVGTTAAIAAGGCAASLSSTTVTLTSANGLTNDVNYHCF